MESLLFNLSSGYAIGDTVEVIPQHVKHFVSNPLPIPSSKRKRFDTVSYDNTTSMAKCIDTRLLVLYVTMLKPIENWNLSRRPHEVFRQRIVK